MGESVVLGIRSSMCWHCSPKVDDSGRKWGSGVTWLVLAGRFPGEETHSPQSRKILALSAPAILLIFEGGFLQELEILVIRSQRLGLLLHRRFSILPCFFFVGEKKERGLKQH